MGLEFTDYVRVLVPSGPSPPQDVVDAMWSTLRRALESEIRHRSLWHAPPRRLGIYGPGHWWEGDALDDLTADCHKFAFLDRLESLRAQLRVKSNVEGLIYRNIQLFLYETQKQHDPLGFKIFTLLHGAVRRAIEAGIVRRVEGDCRIRNNTILAFGPEEHSEPASEIALREVACRWSDDLLPDLVLVERKKEMEQMMDRLATHLAQLASHGIGTFHFGRLVNVFKTAVRERWQAILQQAERDTVLEDDDDDVETTRIVIAVDPDLGVEAHDALTKFFDCVDEMLDRLETSGKKQKTRKAYLERLWTYIKTQVTEDEWGDEPPAYRKISRVLGIPRERVGTLFKELAQLAEPCRPHLSARRSSESTVATRGEARP